MYFHLDTTLVATSIVECDTYILCYWEVPAFLTGLEIFY